MNLEKIHKNLRVGIEAIISMIYMGKNVDGTIYSKLVLVYNVFTDAPSSMVWVRKE